jgi:hypothetical protein
MRRKLALMAVLLPLVRPLPAQDLVSGPEAGRPVTPIRVYAPAGPRAGTEFDVAEAIGAAPGAILFVHEISRNTAPVIGGLDALALEAGLLGFRAFTVALAGDRTAAETQLRNSSAALRLVNPMLLSLAGAEGPGNYALNRKCTLTLVLVKDGKVHRSVPFTDTGRQDLPRIRELIQEVTGPIPADEAGLRAAAGASLPDDVAALKERVVSLTLALVALRRQMQEQQAGARRGGMEPRAGRGDPQRPGAAASRPAPGRQDPGAR